MQCLQEQVYRRVFLAGGTIGRLSEEIYREVAYIAYHFSWSRNEIMSMCHNERRKWVSLIADMNRRINDTMRKKYETQER